MTYLDEIDDLVIVKSIEDDFNVCYYEHFMYFCLK